MIQNPSPDFTNLSPEQESGHPENAQSLRELGALLRAYRSEQSLSLADLASITKVQAQYLEALEKGQMEKLPRGIYRTGYLRAYVEALTMDPAPWTKRFGELSGSQNQRGWVSMMGAFLSSGDKPRLLAVSNEKEKRHRPE